MTTEEKNTALYRKMYAEQEDFRTWLMSQPPEIILEHAYEYKLKEDILLSLEYKDLEDIQAESLLKLDQPLQKVYERLDSKETGYMDSVWETIEECASTEKSRSGSAGYEKENR